MKRYYGWLVLKDVDFQHESKEFGYKGDKMETYQLFDSKPEVEEFDGKWVRDESIGAMEYYHNVRYVCSIKWVGKNNHKPKEFKFENNYAYENIERKGYFGVVTVDGGKITFRALPLEKDYLKRNEVTNEK